MKALFAAALIAAVPVVASASVVTVPVTELVTDFGGPGIGYPLPVTATYEFEIALDAVSLFLSSPSPAQFGTLTYSITTSTGLSYSGTLTQSNITYSLGDFAIGDTIVATYSGASFSSTVVGTSPVPVPAAGLLAMGGIAALGALRARRKKA